MIYVFQFPAYLHHALITLKQNVKLMNIKLAKKEQPCLSLKLEQVSISIAKHQHFYYLLSNYLQPSASSDEIRVVRHDIPVIVIPRRIWAQYQQPNLPKPDVK